MPQEHSFLADEATLDLFLENWRRGALPKSAWTHAAHIAAAAYFAFDHDPPALFARMRAGIMRFNESVGTANTEDSGYHETITRFWCGIVAEFARCQNAASRFALTASAVEVYGKSRDLHTRHYSFDVIKDRHARREWVAPDLSEDFRDPCV